MDDVNEKAIGEITELDTEEVSLVDAAANKKRFLIVKKAKKDEVAEQNQELVQKDASEDGAEGSGHSERAGEGQAEASGEVASEVLALDTEDLKDEDLLNKANEALGEVEDTAIESLTKAFELLKAETQEVKKSVEGATVEALRAELAKASEQLAETVAINKQFRDLLTKAVNVLSPTNPRNVTKAASDVLESNIASSVIESNLETNASDGFLRSGRDLNTQLRGKK